MLSNIKIIVHFLLDFDMFSLNCCINTKNRKGDFSWNKLLTAFWK